MKILLTGMTGYIAQRLLPMLIKQGHTVYCCSRDVERIKLREDSDNIIFVYADFLKSETLSNIPDEIDIAYYLIHSMSAKNRNFPELEKQCAMNFRNRMEHTQVRQVIYLSGIVNDKSLSRHLASRKNVEDILSGARFALTTLRAGIIMGSGSASFEIIRDLVEKLPVMIAPKWLKTKSQPIAVRNVLELLTGVAGKEQYFNKSYDIAGKDILTYKEMLIAFAEVRGLKRYIIILPVLTAKLSSYWLYFVTSTSYQLARNLVDSMKVEILAKPNTLAEELGITLIDYRTSIKLAFDKIKHDDVISTWKDAQISGLLEDGISEHIQVPRYGCFKDVKRVKLKNIEKALDRIWALGGEHGWYYADWLWSARGLLDKLFGGVGILRGRRSPTNILAGEALDFWRVIIADRRIRRFLLYAEMKLPGEAWLEFRINKDGILTQTATFRPLGLKGRLYWYSVLPLHFFIFRGMINRISEPQKC